MSSPTILLLFSLPCFFFLPLPPLFSQSQERHQRFVRDIIIQGDGQKKEVVFAHQHFSFRVGATRGEIECLLSIPPSSGAKRLCILSPSSNTSRKSRTVFGFALLFQSFFCERVEPGNFLCRFCSVQDISSSLLSLSFLPGWKISLAVRKAVQYVSSKKFFGKNNWTIETAHFCKSDLKKHHGICRHENGFSIPAWLRQDFPGGLLSTAILHNDGRLQVEGGGKGEERNERSWRRKKCLLFHAIPKKKKKRLSWKKRVGVFSQSHLTGGGVGDGLEETITTCMYPTRHVDGPTPVRKMSIRLFTSS